jgi:hypothetical protein
MEEKAIPELKDLAPPKRVINNALVSEFRGDKSGSFIVTGEKLKDS